MLTFKSARIRRAHTLGRFIKTSNPHQDIIQIGDVTLIYDELGGYAKGRHVYPNGYGVSLISIPDYGEDLIEIGIFNANEGGLVSNLPFQRNWGDEVTRYWLDDTSGLIEIMKKVQALPPLKQLPTT